MKRPAALCLAVTPAVAHCFEVAARDLLRYPPAGCNGRHQHHRRKLCQREHDSPPSSRVLNGLERTVAVEPFPAHNEIPSAGCKLVAIAGALGRWLDPPGHGDA